MSYLARPPGELTAAPSTCPSRGCALGIRWLGNGDLSDLGGRGALGDVGQAAGRARPGDWRPRRPMRAWLRPSSTCLNMLRSRRARQEELSVHVPNPVVTFEEEGSEHEALPAEFGLSRWLDAFT